jgi:hypothetical protein
MCEPELWADHRLVSKCLFDWERGHNKLSSGVLLALLTALLVLVPGEKVQAQSATRPFQISLWECCGTQGSSGNPTPTSADTDIREFGYQLETNPTVMQPTSNPSILVIPGSEVTQNPNLTLSQLTNVSDWSQIAAVEIDEVYGSIDRDLDLIFCTLPRSSDIQPIDTHLSALETELRAKNPKARFWVNFTSTEAKYILWCGTTYVFNRPYIDVISTDWYSRYFDDDLQQFYITVREQAATPYQQVALFPGVFSAPKSQLSYLQGYFDYATTANQTCNLPLGPQGITGLYDGCPVWIVMGFLSGDYNGAEYKGLLDPASRAIRTAWEAEVALTPVTSTQRARSKILLPVLQLLLP